MKHLMIFKTALVILACLISHSIISQPAYDPCGMPDPDPSGELPGSSSCGKTSPLWRTDELFIPTDDYGNINVRINLIFIQREDGTGNFDIDDPVHMAFINDGIDRLNHYMGNLHDVCPNGGHTFVSDAKIRYVPAYYEYRDEALWNNENHGLCPSWWNGGIKTFSENVHNDPTQYPEFANMQKGINIFYTNDASLYNGLLAGVVCTEAEYSAEREHYQQCSEYPSSNLTRTSRLHIPDRYSKYYWFLHTNCVTWGDHAAKRWNLVNGMAWSLAHELGHSLLLPHTSCTDAVMRGQSGGSRRHFSPKELGKAHRALAITNLRQFVDCNAMYDSPTYNSNRLVTSDETWDINIRMYNDVIVKTGAELTVSCELFMSEDAKIIVERGARLIVDGGKISKGLTCDDNQWWRGINVWGNANMEQPFDHFLDPLLPDESGVVYLTNDAIIEEAVVGIRTRRSEVDWLTQKDHWGGLIIAENSTFYNNRKSAEFMKYDFQNYSSFTDCDFIADDGHPYAGVTMWNTYGVKLDNCKFEDIRDIGIGCYDCGFQVYEGSEFKGIGHGVEVTNSSALAAYPVLVGVPGTIRNHFHINTVGVRGLSAHRVFVYDNDFDEVGSFGCAFTGESSYAIEGNLFEDIQIGNEHEATGSAFKYTACNTYSNNLVGNLADGPNKGYVFDNDIFSTTYDLNLQDGIFGVGEINPQQGDVNNPRFNEFSTGVNNIFTSASSPVFAYVLYDPQINPRWEPYCGFNGGCSPRTGNFFRGYTFGDNDDCLNNSGTTEIPDGGYSGPSIHGEIVSQNGIISQFSLQLSEGNSPSLLSGVQAATISQSTINALYAASPYLSDTILNIWSHRTDISDNDKKALLEANRPLSLSLIDKIETEISANYRDSLYNEILSEFFSSTQRLNVQIDSINQFQSNMISDWIYDKLLVPDLDSIEFICSTFSTRENYKKLVAVYFITNNLQKVDSLLALYPTQTQEDQDFIFSQEMRKEVLDSGFSLDSASIDELYQISSRSVASSGYAKAILSMVEDTLFYPEFSLPQAMSRYDKHQPEEKMDDATMNQVTQRDFDIFPNPSNSQIQLVLPGSSDYYNIEIVTIQGRVHKFNRQFTTGSSLDISDLPNGSYTLIATHIDSKRQHWLRFNKL